MYFGGIVRRSMIHIYYAGVKQELASIIWVHLFLARSLSLFLSVVYLAMQSHLARWYFPLRLCCCNIFIHLRALFRIIRNLTSEFNCIRSLKGFSSIRSVWYYSFFSIAFLSDFLFASHSCPLALYQNGIITQCYLFAYTHFNFANTRTVRSR